MKWPLNSHYSGLFKRQIVLTIKQVQHESHVHEILQPEFFFITRILIIFLVCSETLKYNVRVSSTLFWLNGHRYHSGQTCHPHINMIQSSTWNKVTDTYMSWQNTNTHCPSNSITFCDDYIHYSETHMHTRSHSLLLGHYCAHLKLIDKKIKHNLKTPSDLHWSYTVQCVHYMIGTSWLLNRTLKSTLNWFPNLVGEAERINREGCSWIHNDGKCFDGNLSLKININQSPPLKSLRKQPWCNSLHYLCQVTLKNIKGCSPWQIVGCHGNDTSGRISLFALLKLPTTQLYQCDGKRIQTHRCFLLPCCKSAVHLCQ